MIFKLHDSGTKTPLGETSSFLKLLKTKWEEAQSKHNVLRYAIQNVQERIVDGKYILLLNTDRGSNRRTPEYIENIHQPFDDTKFNFTKVSEKEILFSINHDGDEHVIIVNVSPISQYHSMLCPSVNKKLPQVVTESNLSLAVEILFKAQDSDLKIGFNSLCGMASVNHLHYHLFIVKHTFPIDLAKWKHIKGSLNILEGYPVPVFRFEVVKPSLHDQVKEIYKLIKHLLEKSIAHNLLLTYKSSSVTVFVVPRKSVAGMKPLVEYNIAVVEISGWFPVYSAKAYERLDIEEIENELKKWQIDNFEELCKDLERLH